MTKSMDAIISHNTWNTWTCMIYDKVIFMVLMHLSRVNCWNLPTGNRQIRLEIRPNPLCLLLNGIGKLIETILRLDRDLLGRVPSTLKDLFGRVVSLTSLLGGESGKNVNLDLELVELGRSERRGSEKVGKSVY